MEMEEQKKQQKPSPITLEEKVKTNLELEKYLKE